MPESKNDLTDAIHADIAEVELALNTQYKGQDWKVDEASILLRCRAVNKNGKSLVLNREPTTSIVGVGTDGEKVIGPFVPPVETKTPSATPAPPAQG